MKLSLNLVFEDDNEHILREFILLKDFVILIAL